MPFTIANDEQQIFIAQKHWFILFAELFPLGFIYCLAMGALLGFFPSFSSAYFTHAGALTTFIAAFVSFLFWLFAWLLWLDFHLDAWVITTKRIIDLNQRSIFTRDVTEIWLDRVQDVTIQVDGIIPSLLHFGTVRVQTASESRGFKLRGVANPYKVQEIIFRALSAHKEAENRKGTGV
jgi:uncharacterized membrane protein YdbT with pleckstrin-like domain